MMKSNLRKGASFDAMALMLIKLMTICLGFVITRLLSQYLSTYEYGTYSQILLIASTVQSLTTLGMIDGVNFFNCREQDPRKREAYIATLFVMQCAVSMGMGALLLLLRGMISDGFENPALDRLMVFGAVLPLLQNLIFMLQVLVVSVGKARMLAVRNLAVSLFRLGAVFVVVTLVKNIAFILTATVILDVLQVAVFLWILRQNGCLIRPKTADFRLSRQILSYCIPMAVFVAMNSMNRDCDKYLIALLTDTQTLAVYSNASKALPFDIVATSFFTVLQPETTRQVADGKREQAAMLYKRFLEIAYISTGIFCCAALSAAPQLMELLYSAKYLEGLPVFCIYILVDLLRFTNITLILTATGKTKTLMYLGFGTLSANAVLNILMFRAMGTTGPAAATLLVTLLTGVLMLHLSAKALGTKLWGFFDIPYLAIFALESLAAVLLFSRLQRFLVSAGLSYFLVLIVVCGLYGVTMLLLNGRRLLQDMKQINRTTE